MPIPTPRLLLLSLGVAVLVGLGTLGQLFLLLALIYLAVLLCMMGYEYLTGPRSRDFLVERRHEPRLSIAEPNQVVVWVSWSSAGRIAGKALRLWLRDQAPAGIPVDQRVLTGTIAADEPWQGEYHLTPTRRGSYAFGDAYLRVELPWGLLRRQYRFRVAEPVAVYPNLLALRRYELLSSRSRAHELGLRNARLFGEGTEFERLREYLPDDDFRRINWKATARLRQPVTVAYETERSQNLMLMLDTGRLMGAPAGAQGIDKLDHAINAALFLTNLALRYGDRVGLLGFSDQVRHFLPPARGRPQLGAVLDQLQRLQLEPVESDPRRALAFLAEHLARRSLIVLFTDLADSEQSTELAVAMGLLARRHLVLCVALNDPALVRLAEQSPSDTRAAYELVVARRLLDERRTLLHRLERAGVLTLDVGAEQLTAETVNRYLEIKARSRL